ncbi:glycosyl hydrolase family 18 protein [Streptomyces sp. NPDC051993]|uniref:glycosyl hydrolase family 18 protein n=1 Tax=Streptomyces sp. NPDC051993 TaxID=3155286 RepID=UPI00342DD75C
MAARATRSHPPRIHPLVTFDGGSAIMVHVYWKTLICRKGPMARARMLLATALVVVLAGCSAGHRAGDGDRSSPRPSSSVGGANPAETSALPGLEAWVYPGSTGEDTCGAAAEYRDGRLRHGVLKPQYWDVDSSGALKLLDSDLHPCNGFSEANAADVKGYSAAQYTTVSAMDRSAIAALVSDPARRAAAVGSLTELAKRIGFTGVDIDFEDFWAWTADDERGYEAFLTELGGSLHRAGLKLQVDAPVETHDGDSVFSYAAVMRTGVDQLVVMDYGRQFNTPEGETCWAVSPHSWVREAVTYAQSQVPDKDRLVIGLPSYGFTAPDPCVPDKVKDSVALATIRRAPGYSDDRRTTAARRDSASGEVRWTAGGTLYDYTDQQGMDAKLAVLQQLGVTHVSVWTLGGNPWFSAGALRRAAR